MYHIWYEQNPDLLPADLLNEQDKEVSEKKANRFAAEFLIDKQLLYQEIDLYMIREITIESILRLADLFTVPYRTMVKRLWEAEVINDAKLNEFLLETEDSVDKYRKRYSISCQKPDERVAIDNLVDLAVSAYELGHITYEKLEYLLRMSKLEPKDIGIEKKAVYGFPSDDELDSIMEE